MTSLGAVVDELYALVPDDFTAARDAASRAARDDGDREQAATLKALRRPSVSAWMVNQLARRHADRIDELLDLGEELRAAQDALQGAELRALTRRRHELVGALADLAGEAAAESGRRVGDGVRREIEATLDAALADAQAADAVRSGHLMRPLSSTGLEAVDLTDAVAADLMPPPRRRRAPKTKAPKEPARKATQRDQRAVREARAALERAEAELTAQDESVRAAQSAVDAARERVAEVEEQLSDARGRERAAERERRKADQSRRTALRAREAAARAVQTAERRASG
jgi:hypothetical protein